MAEVYGTSPAYLLLGPCTYQFVEEDVAAQFTRLTALFPRQKRQALQSLAALIDSLRSDEDDDT